MGKKQKKPGKGKEKTERKTVKGEEKRARREARKVGEEDDIDAILVSNLSPLSIPPDPFHVRYESGHAWRPRGGCSFCCATACSCAYSQLLALAEITGARYACLIYGFSNLFAPFYLWISCVRSLLLHFVELLLCT